MVLRIKNLEGHKNFMIGSKVMTILTTFLVHGYLGLFNRPGVTCHMSYVMCHVSCVTCQDNIFFFFDKLVKLVGGGSALNGVTPSIF